VTASPGATEVTVAEANGASGCVLGARSPQPSGLVWGTIALAACLPSAGALPFGPAPRLARDRAQGIGSSTVKMLPLPSWLDTQIWPP
jgi:hypothetical protein